MLDGERGGEAAYLFNLSNRTAKRLQRRNHEYDLALWRTCFIVREEFAGGSAPEFFEFLCKLARDAELPIRHEDGARAERFRQAVRGFKKDRGFVAGSGCTQFPFSLSAFDRKKSAEVKSLG